MILQWHVKTIRLKLAVILFGSMQTIVDLKYKASK